MVNIPGNKVKVTQKILAGQVKFFWQKVFQSKLGYLLVFLEKQLIGETHLIGRSIVYQAILYQAILSLLRYIQLKLGFSSCNFPTLLSPVVLFWNSPMVWCSQWVHFSQYISILSQYLKKTTQKYLFLMDTYCTSILLFAKSK